MQVIGLVGGSYEARERFAQQLIKFSRKTIATVYLPDAGLYQCSADSLAHGLSLFRSDGADKTALIEHVLSRSDADFIRSKGGYLWHLRGVPSDSIPICRGDRLVTETPGGVRHFLDAEEAFALLEHQAASLMRAR